VSGRGNAVVELRDLPTPGAGDERAELRRRADAMAFEHPDVRLPTYLAQLAQDGGIVEERVTGDEIRSPSVQLRVTPLGESSCSPRTTSCSVGRADRATSAAASRPTLTTRKRSAAGRADRRAPRTGGVLGRFAVDFVVARDARGAWTPYAIELTCARAARRIPS